MSAASARLLWCVIAMGGAVPRAGAANTSTTGPGSDEVTDFGDVFDAFEPVEPAPDIEAAGSVPPLSVGLGAGARVSLGGEVEGRLAHEERRPTLINPDRIFVGPRRTEGRFTLVPDLRLVSPWVDVVVRDTVLLWWDGTDGDASNFLNEAYAVARIGSELILLVGVENVVDGVAYALNPMDMLAQRSRELEGTERDARAVIQRREGLFVVKATYLMQSGQVTLLGSPRVAGFEVNDRTRLYARVALTLDNFDVAIAGLHEGEVPGGGSAEYRAGAEVAVALGQQLVAYGAAVGGHRMRRDVFETVAVGPVGKGAFDEVIIRPDEGFAMEGVAGLSYTGSMNVNIIAEYYYGGLGYGTDAWGRYVDVLEASSSPHLPGPLRELKTSYLGEALSRLEAGKVRRHYVFVRVATPFITDSDFDLSMFEMIGIEDGSGITNVTVDWSLHEDARVSVSASLFVGGDNTEFGLVPNALELSTRLVYDF